MVRCELSLVQELYKVAHREGGDMRTVAGLEPQILPCASLQFVRCGVSAAPDWTARHDHDR